MKYLTLLSGLVFSATALAAPPLSTAELNKLRQTFPPAWHWDITKNSILPDYVLMTETQSDTFPSPIKKDFKEYYFQPIKRDGSLGKFFTQEELAKTRADQFTKMDKSPLISVTYGNGTKKVLVISALDCPACKQLEGKLMKMENQLDVTIYYVPMTLDRQQNQVITNFWCASDKSAAWLNFWRKSILPPQANGSCQYTFQDSYALRMFFGTRDKPLNFYGTPSIHLEDGSIYEGIPSQEKLDEIFGKRK